jgi:ABC-2 type transport system ATP-binding protein
MIDVEHLVKDYGTVVAVRDLSFSVGRGEVVGFLGPNGAGKSTTLRILAGFLGATSGRVRIDGTDIAEDGVRARRSIGYMPEAAPLYPEMRVNEYLRFRAELKRVSRRERRAAVERVMAAASVTEMKDTLIGHLSKGYKQRVGLADALVANPPLLILDEPTAGLDPNQIRDVRKLIRELGESHTILLSTHILSEVETTCDRAVVIDRGRLVAEGTIDELKGGRRGRAAVVVVSDPEGTAESVASGVPGIEAVTRDVVPGAGGISRLVVRFVEEDDGVRLAAVVDALVGRGLSVREASPEKATLEDVFVQLTLAEVAAGSEEATA